MLIRYKRKMHGKQLDYILVSHRWLTCIKDVNVRWGPSEHRNIYGRADHALVECVFSWRVRCPKKTKRRNFSSLFEAMCESTREKFDSSFKQRMTEINDGHNGAAVSIEQQYADLCDAIQHSCETLPEVEKTSHIKREVSNATKALFAERVKMGRKKNVTQKQFDGMQKRIKEACLNDFKSWVERWVQDMDDANAIGDTKRVWEGVRTLSGKINTKPPINLTETSEGEPIDSPEQLAKTWYVFL